MSFLSRLLFWHDWCKGGLAVLWDYSHLVLVGWVELAPGLWVVVLIPEAANVQRFMACRIKRSRAKENKDRT